MAFIVGCHLSASNGFLAMGQMPCRLRPILSVFTRNRGGAAKAIDPEDVQAFLAWPGNSFGPVLAMRYT